MVIMWIIHGPALASAPRVVSPGPPRTQPINHVEPLHGGVGPVKEDGEDCGHTDLPPRAAGEASSQHGRGSSQLIDGGGHRMT